MIIIFVQIYTCFECHVKYRLIILLVCFNKSSGTQMLEDLKAFGIKVQVEKQGFQLFFLFFIQRITDAEGVGRHPGRSCQDNEFRSNPRVRSLRFRSKSVC